MSEQDITFAQPERMNLIAYFIRDLLRTKLSDSSAASRIKSLRGAFLFDAGGMQSTVEFREDGIRIHPGATPAANAAISGDLQTLLEVVLGANYVEFLLRRRIRIGGNPVRLLRLVRALRE